jgi:ABC-type bacteriocin/lantibiotic exporter with double-glycine peptidase domain
MFRALFYSPTLVLALLFVILQQGAVASSTWFLARATANAQSPAMILPWLIGFLVSLSLPYIPGLFASREVAKLKNSAQRKVLELLRATIQGKTTLFANKAERERRFVFLQREGEDFVTQSCDAGFDFTQTIFNVILNISALVIVVHPALLPAYVLSLAFMSITTHLGKKTLTEATREQRIARIGFDAVQLTAWENLTIGNTTNTARWNSSLDSRFENLAVKRLNLSTLREVSSLLSTWAAMIPVLSANVWMVSKASSSAELALFVATLPRQLMVLNHLHIVSSWSGFFHELRERYEGLRNALSPVPRTLNIEHDRNIRFSELQLKSVGETAGTSELGNSANTEKLAQWAESTKQGRFKIEGKNGSGKSTLLRALKEYIGGDAFYLPAEHSALDFPVANGLSSGQRARSILESLKISAPRVLLLDEWDANLDPRHRSLLDQVISQLAEQHLVIEVRHN